MNHALYVFAGGGLGALARWLLSSALQRRLGVDFPLGTLVVNVVGCLAAGWIVGWLEQRAGAGEGFRLFLVVGVLGGFTTFSAFGVEVLTLTRDGRPSTATLYVAASLALGLAAATFGRWLAGPHA